MTGVTSSRDAATVTWATAVAKSSAGSTPVRSVTWGSVGYSSTGIDPRVNFAEPHCTAILPSTVENWTGAFGSRLAMSASSRPETSALPGSSTSAVISVRDDTS